jgi:hypothetical protein
MTTKSIYCCGCKAEVNARLTDGSEVYPHRKDLYSLPFWKCDTCNNFVGCHHKTKDRTRPMGVISTPEVKNARKHIHRILDPIWKGVKRKRSKRKELYKEISNYLGYEYHTGDIRTVEQARDVYRFIKNELL